MSYMPFLWFAVIILAGALEAVTTQLVSIWFVVGGIAALIANLLGAPLPVQFLIFAAASAVALIVTRPFVKRVLNIKRVGTNADRYIGKIGIVTVEIDNENGHGQVNVLGSIWTARSADSTVIPVGERVNVELIDGVKLLVRPCVKDS